MLKVTQKIPRKVTLRLDGDDDIIQAAEQLISSGKSNTITESAAPNRALVMRHSTCFRIGVYALVPCEMPYRGGA